MPYGPEAASRHTKKARTPKQKRQWSHVFNSALKRGASESSAFAQAAGVVKRGGRKSKRSARRSRRSRRY